MATTTPPALVLGYATAFNITTKPRTLDVDVDADDMLCVAAVGEGQMFFGTPSGGGLTYSLQQQISIANNAEVALWTASSATTQSLTIQLSHSGSSAFWWGFSCLRFAGCSGVGASQKATVATGAPTLAITTTGDDSAMVVVNGDWNAIDGASRTWRSVNGAPATEQSYFRDAAHYGAYVGYHPDCGLAGAQSVGLSAPTGQLYSLAAVELLGAPEASPGRISPYWQQAVSASLQF